MSNIEPEAVEAYQAHLKTEHEVSALALFAGGFTAGRATAAPAPAPATEEMLALAREAIADEATYAARLLAVAVGEELLRAFLAEHGRPVPAADPLASMRADLKVKKTPDVDD